jgi:hypothetical protein
MDRRFSFASVILSYFLVAGGLLAGALAVAYMKTTNEVVGILMYAVGSFVGAFIAGRASKGSTIIEPVIGAVLVIATFVGMVAASDIGKEMWASASNETAKVAIELALSIAVGAFAGAFVAEKFFGESTTSAFPWIAYTAFATMGGCFLATIIAAWLFVKGGSSESKSAIDKLVAMMFAGMGIGCILSGIASGASARVRVLGASFLGGAIGVAGFCLLVTRGASNSSDAAAGIAVLAGGGAIVTFIGSAIGWFTVGKRSAG